MDLTEKSYVCHPVPRSLPSPTFCNLLLKLAWGKIHVGIHLVQRNCKRKKNLQCHYLRISGVGLHKRVQEISPGLAHCVVLKRGDAEWSRASKEGMDFRISRESEKYCKKHLFLISIPTIVKIWLDIGAISQG